MVRDTAEIRPEERFDETRVAAYLRSHLPEFVGVHPITFDQFPGGAANLTYRAVAGETELVLRRAPLGPVAKGGHDMVREHKVLSRLWRGFPKAPRALLLCADPDVMGKPFFVMERRRGWVVRDAWPPPYAGDPALRRRLATDVVETLADLHMVDPSSVDLADLGHPDGFVARQIEGWWGRWERAMTRAVPDMVTLRRLLVERIPTPQTVAILHNDYKLDNTMVSDAGDVVAVLDWDMATRGDPLVDVGTLLAYWAEPDGPTFPILGERAVSIAPDLRKEEVVARYAGRTGLDLSEVRFYESLALYRIAVVVEQIYARYVARQTSDPRFARFEPLAPILVAAAVATLEDTY